MHTELWTTIRDCVRCLLAEDDVHVNAQNFATGLIPLHVFLSKRKILSQIDLVDVLLPKPLADKKAEGWINLLTKKNVSFLMIAAANHDLGSVRQVAKSKIFENDSFENEGCAVEVGKVRGKAKTGPIHRESFANRDKADVVYRVLDQGNQTREGGDEMDTEGKKGILSGGTSAKFILEFLVEWGADPALQDIHGCSALDYAARSGVRSC